MQLQITSLTLEEILHYGGLGELKVTTDEEWEHLTELIREEQDKCYKGIKINY